MIDPKELRIGNLVSTNVDTGTIIMPTGFPFIVYTIGFSGCEILNDLSKPWAQQEPFPAKYNRLEPIPITPEWLERLGFERKYKNENTIHWVKFSAKHLSFVITECSSLFGMEYNAYGADHCPQIFHIHQLQNLYHALTGQELTVKELTAI